MSCSEIGKKNLRVANIRIGYTQIRVVDCNARIQVSPAALDAAAELKLTGGYNNKRNPLCRSCYVRKSNSGECNC